MNAFAHESTAPHAVNSSLPAASMDWLDDASIITWAMSQTNAALRRRRDAVVGEKILQNARLPLHPDAVKNWDTCLALVHATTTTEPAAPVLDAGAERYSPFLPALARLGYTDLTGVNLTFGAPERASGATLCHGDITRLAYADQHFGCIVCLSVIEHGVDFAAFIAEAARVLRPAGTLFLSFDYWQDPVDTHGHQAYGAPIRIFTRDDVQTMIEEAGRVGLDIDGTVDLHCEDRVVHWQRFDLHYTFANLVFRKSVR